MSTTFLTRSTAILTRLSGSSVSSSCTASIPTRCLHANRASICRIKRPPSEYCRHYPVSVVFQDGSTVTVRHQVPREIIKLPFLFEDCGSEVERKAWLGRRKPKEVIEIKKDDTDVAYNQMQYIKTAKKSSAGSSKGKK